MFDTISQYIDKMPVWGWVLTGLVVLLIGIVSSGDDTTSSEDEEDTDNDMSDIIICSVPGQEVITFLPNQYVDYTLDYYNGYVEVTLKNGNTCFVPSPYTTIIDTSFKTLPKA